MHAVNAIPTVLAAEPGLYDLSTATPFVAHWTSFGGSSGSDNVRSQ
jgi:hypothetical protein